MYQEKYGNPDMWAVRNILLHMEQIPSDLLTAWKWCQIDKLISDLVK
jgi:hypothetical protein